ncbi:hypothetical protein WA026_018689 [Henosepilachna vigintioctopunctata]|uniref:Protein kinase domain-containing protein n=1 Tax=Henosepilachna vigintioctopunctata TaxID=420089 RepID=A0AAW1TW40_9CUCU
MSSRSLRRKIQSSRNAKNQDVLDLDFEGPMYEKGEDDDNFLLEYVDFIDFIVLMLKYDSSERITPSEALNHKFFKRKAKYEEEFRKKIDQSGSDSRSVWNVIKSINENNFGGRGPIRIRNDEDDEVVQSDFDTASVFNEFFSTVGQRLADSTKRPKVDPYVRARPYRSPELVLHSRIGVPTDMWSLGCILVEMFTADTLFAVSDSTAQINKFVEVLGMPPSSILDSSTRSTKFFEKTPGSDRYVLKKPLNGETYKAAGMRKMQDILDIDLEGSMYEKGEDDDNFLYEYVDFIDLILLMLKYDPSERITPCEALNHKFFNSQEE